MKKNAKQNKVQVRYCFLPKSANCSYIEVRAINKRGGWGRKVASFNGGELAKAKATTFAQAVVIVVYESL